MEELLQKLSCKNCGSRFVKQVGNYIVCDSCESKHVIVKARMEYDAELNMCVASRNRLKFADAQAKCRVILAKDENNAEALWQMVLIDYQVVYMVDYDKKTKPIVVKYIERPIAENPCYKRLLTTGENVEGYVQNAKKLQALLDETKLLLSEKAEYDFFICVKINRAGTELLSVKEKIKTRDFDFAYKEYLRLTNAGKKVFLSEEAIIGGVRNDSQIYAALHRSKALVVITASNQHMESPWVKSEWMRFLNLIELGKRTNDSLITLGIDDFSEDDLPLELQKAKLQIYRNNMAGDLDRFREHVERFYNTYCKPKGANLPNFNAKTIEGGQVATINAVVKTEEIKQTQLGTYTIQKVSVSDEQTIKEVESAIRRGVFGLALQDIENELMPTNENNYVVRFFELQAKTQSKTEDEFWSNLNNLSNIDAVKALLSCAPNDFRKWFVEKWIELWSKETNSGILPVQLKQIDFLVGLEEYATNYKKLVLAVENFAVETENKNLVSLTEKLLGSDGQKHIDFYYRLIKKGKIEYRDKVLAINKFHAPTLWEMFKKKYFDGSILQSDEHAEFEVICKYSTMKEREGYLDEIMAVLFRYITYDKKGFQEDFEYYLSLYPETSPKRQKLLAEVVSEAQKVGFWSFAERYCAMAIALNESDENLYLLLLQTKLHCRTTDDLAFIQEPRIQATDEFRMAQKLALEHGNTKLSDLLGELRIKQYQNIEQGKTKQMAAETMSEQEKEEQQAIDLLKNNPDFAKSYLATTEELQSIDFEDGNIAIYKGNKFIRIGKVKVVETISVQEDCMEDYQTTEERKGFFGTRTVTVKKQRPAKKIVQKQVAREVDGVYNLSAPALAAATKRAGFAVGKTVKLGAYPQTASGNDKTPIEWRVLAVNGDKAILLSEKILDSRAYSASGKVVWQDSDARQFLNGEFYNNAFSTDEKRAIQEYTCTGNNEGHSGNNPDTRDKVWLLNKAEVDKYKQALGTEDYDDKRKAIGTDYAKKRGLFVYSGDNNDGYLPKGNKANGCSFWWLRSAYTFVPVVRVRSVFAAYDSGLAAYDSGLADSASAHVRVVGSNGLAESAPVRSVDYIGLYDHKPYPTSNGVRPACAVSLSSLL